VFVARLTNHVLTSSNVVTWTETTITGGGGSTAICYAEDLGEALVISDDTAFTSTNGTTWTEKGALDSSMSWQRVCRSPELGIYVAVASNGSGEDTIAISED